VARGLEHWSTIPFPGKGCSPPSAGSVLEPDFTELWVLISPLFLPLLSQLVR
jgi:hypothetical protein